ncbi:hypothetical protein OUZ56_024467 [Daphnia magna]|uniref:Uncharacterized protein n=1 Tax=Daphnia magna TaxID=35525 RepID=A0ABR0B0V2_9CRUS|nr:hypothetical protein OUZ56_024467 [Daphnia magna]
MELSGEDVSDTETGDFSSSSSSELLSKPCLANFRANRLFILSDVIILLKRRLGVDAVERTSSGRGLGIAVALMCTAVGFFIFRDMDTVILDQGMNYVARLAQLVERGTFNPEVEGSSSSSGAI